MNTGFTGLLKMINTTDFRFRWRTKPKGATSKKEGNLSSPRTAAMRQRLHDQHPVGLRGHGFNLLVTTKTYAPAVTRRKDVGQI